MILRSLLKPAKMVINSFEKQYHVHVFDTGPDGNLNPHSLFDFYQDIASDHAVKLGYGREELLRANRFWVLSRIYSVIYNLPSWGDAIIVQTWPKGTERLFALRDYEVRSESGEILAAASSSWLIIDQTTKRICRPDSTLTGYKPEASERVSLPRNAAKLEYGEAGMKAMAQFRVRVSDLDVNLHSNNVKYLKWVMDSYDIDFVTNKIPISVEINYLAESRFDDGITVSGIGTGDDGMTFNHLIVRSQDNTPLSKIRIVWKEKTASKSNVK